MSGRAATGPGPWVVISNFPTWPSPYFAELERHAPPALRLEFAAHLDALAARPGPPGVINLHRLKRLYQESGGQRTQAGAEAMLERLADLRVAGWRVVWTVHGLLPIDGGPPGVADQGADRHAAHGVLALADAVVTHTRADADHVATLTRAPVIVAGWAAPTPAPGPAPAPVTDLARDMAAAPFAVLVLGNMAVHKDLPAVVDAFNLATRHAELFLVGPSRDRELTGTLARRAADGDGRVHLHPQRIPPGHVHVLYQAADAALCPYRVDGPWSFLGQMFYPGSVATALAYDTPVIAPDLPAIREMTEDRPRWLYTPAAGPGPALTVAETGAAGEPTAPTSPASPGVPDHAERWRTIGATYARLTQTMHATRTPVRPAGRPSSLASKELLVPTPSTTSSTDTIAAVLADRYGLIVRGMAQLPIGQGTVNYRATCDDCEVFVKHYPLGADLAAEERAIGLSELARRHDIPAAAVVANRHGQLIDVSTSHAVSVWQWMPGRVVTGMNTEQYAQAGDALGRIHVAFAPLPDSAGPAPEADNWRRRDPARLMATIDQLLGIIADRTQAGSADAFDVQAAQTLTERRAMLERIPKLLAELPSGLTTQVVHGDYSPVNLLFAGDTLTAVLDFRPPNPFLVSYDLGRMAFFPHTVTGDPDWLRAAHTFIAAYRRANPAVADADILACGRVALLQLLGSLYGVKQHYLKPKPGLFQDALDEFWLLRHQAVATLLDHLADTDQLLADLVATPTADR